MEGFMVNFSINFIKVGVLIYDIVMYPFYAIIQQPWRSHKQMEIKAVKVPSSEGVCFRSVLPLSDVQIEMERQKINTLEKLLSYSAQKYPDTKALGTRKVTKEYNEVQKNGKIFKKLEMEDYSWISYSEFNETARQFGRGLRVIGHEPKENIIILSETRAEWLMSAMGAFKQNIIVCTLYATLGESAIIQGINETEVRHVITSYELIPKFKEILKSCPKVEKVIYFPDQLHATDTSGFSNVTFFSFDKIVELGKNVSIPDNVPLPGDTAFIMYTSGSTGAPKGVMMCHSNLTSAISGFSGIFTAEKDDIYLAFLPLAHVLELIGECVMLMLGLPMGYSSPLTMTDRSTKVKRGCKGDVSVLHPTIFPSVPLIMDRIYKGILDKVADQGPFLKALFDFGVKYRLNWYFRGWETPFCNWFVFRKIRALLGGKIRMLATGGAPLSPDTHNFIRASLGAPLLQGYGLTETCGCASLMIPTDTSTGRVGVPLNVNDIKLIDWEEGNYRITDKPNPRGEVVIGGTNVTKGYYKNPQKTEEDFYETDGRRWFKTGDIGEVEPDGCLKIIDRKKDLVKLQFGEYVSLGKVEAELKVCPLVENVCVYGDSLRNSIVAIVVPDLKSLRNLAGQHYLDESESIEELCERKEIVNAYMKELTETAKKAKLEKFEFPSAIHLTPDHWTPESGLVTAAFKLKRKPLQLEYQDVINHLYGA